MTSFDYNTAEDYKGIRFGICLIEITDKLGLPTPSIQGSPLRKFHKEGCWTIKAIQRGRETEPKTEDIVIKLVSDSKEKALSIVMQELIGRLCGRHYQELQDTYAAHFGRRDEEGRPISISQEDRMTVKRRRLHFQDLEDHINNLEEESCFELLRNDELCALVKEKEAKIKSQEEMIQALGVKFEAQEKKFKSQEKRVQEKNKKIKEQEKLLASNEAEFETDHDLIEKLRSEKRALQEKNEALTAELLAKREDEDSITKLRAEKTDLQERIEEMAKEVIQYKEMLAEEGIEVEEQEVID